MTSIEVLLGFVILLFLFKLYKRKHNLPPGPWGLPFIGNAHQIGKSPHLDHCEFAKRYGEIHYISLLGQPIVILNTIEMMEKCNFGSSNDFNHRPIWMKNLTSLLSPGIVFKGEDDYLHNRRFVLTNLKRRGMGRAGLEGEILRELDQLITFLHSNPQLDPQTVLKGFTSNTIMTMCFGKRWEYGDESYEVFSESIHKLAKNSAVLALEDLVPISVYLPAVRKAKKELLKSVDHIRGQFEKIIVARIAGDDKDCHDDIIGDYMKIHEDMDEDHIKNIIDICHDLFFAGSETTSSTINFAIIHLLNNPSWQDQVFRELQSVLEGRNPTMADLQNLPNMEATIQETLRINPQAPLIFNANSREKKLGGYRIPANSMVMINAYHINHDPQIFPQPTRFNAQRWLSPEGKFRSDLVEKVPTFGVGRRVCLGRPLARMEIFLSLAKLLQQFHLSVPDGDPAPCGTGEADGFLFLAPAYTLKLTRRNTDFK